MQELIELFVREKRFLKNVTPKTISFYYQSLRALTKIIGDIEPLQLSKSLLNDVIVKLREGGLSARSCNTYISGWNSFLSWLHENGYTSEHLKVRELKTEQRIVQTFTEEEMRLIISYKPKKPSERRVHTLACLLLDTGLRVEEALTLELPKVDLDNMLVTVYGKGSKERIVPISFGCRKILWQYLKQRKAPGRLLFCTRNGSRLTYRNAARDFKLFCDKLKISGSRRLFHCLRHTFAYNYARSFAQLTGSAENGIFHLQKQLGHTTLAMTRRYVELQPEDLKAAHDKVSILNRIK